MEEREKCLGRFIPVGHCGFSSCPLFIKSPCHIRGGFCVQAWQLISFEVLEDLAFPSFCPLKVISSAPAAQESAEVGAAYGAEVRRLEQERDEKRRDYAEAEEKLEDAKAGIKVPTFVVDFGYDPPVIVSSPAPKKKGLGKKK